MRALCTCTFVVLALLLVISLAHVARSFATGEAFKGRDLHAPAASTRSIGSRASVLLKDADASVSGVLSVSASLAYTPFRVTHALRVASARRDSIRLYDADTLIAHGAFSSAQFQLSASPRSVVEAGRIRSDLHTAGGSVRVFRARPMGHTREFRVTHTASPAIDFAIRRDGPITVALDGIRAAIDLDEYPPVLVAPRFWTPEVLKRDSMIGMTLVVPMSGQPGIVALRRYRKSSGAFLLSVEPRGRTSVVIKQARCHVSIGHAHDAASVLGWRSPERVQDAVEAVVSMQSPFSFMIISVTPGEIRVTAVGQSLESHMFTVPMMRMPTSYFAPHPSHPLQLANWNAYALPFPAGDHMHLASVFSKHSR